MCFLLFSLLLYKYEPAIHHICTFKFHYCVFPWFSVTYTVTSHALTYHTHLPSPFFGYMHVYIHTAHTPLDTQTWPPPPLPPRLPAVPPSYWLTPHHPPPSIPHPHYQYISVGFDLSDTDLKKLSERNVVNKGSTSYGVLPPYFVGYPSLCYAKTNQPTN